MRKAKNKMAVKKNSLDGAPIAFILNWELLVLVCLSVCQFALVYHLVKRLTVFYRYLFFRMFGVAGYTVGVCIGKWDICRWMGA